MNHKTIISTTTLAGTLAGYYFSKWNERHRIPLMLIGSFAGTLLGEVLVTKMEKANP